MIRFFLATILLASVLAGCASPTPAPTQIPSLAPTAPPTLTTAPTATELPPTATLPPPTETPVPVPTIELVDGFPPQPEGVPFPAEDWPVGEWPAWVDRQAVDAAVETAFNNGADQRVRAVVVIHGGKLIYEAYSPNSSDGPERAMPGHSIAKSFTSTLAGILVRDGRLDVNDPANAPEWPAGDPRRAITIDNLLRMESGLAFDQGRPPSFGDQGAMLGEQDGAAFAAAKELIAPPGTEFHYSSGNTMIVARILAEEVGTRDDFTAFLHAELLDKIGMAGINPQYDPAGTWHGWFAADATARDFARFGLLYLRDGVWDGERILPEGWVDYSRTPASTNPEYGAGWWLDLLRPGVMYAVGVNGQAITVDPAHDLVVVTLATDSALSLPVSETIQRAFEGQ